MNCKIFVCVCVRICQKTGHFARIIGLHLLITLKARQNGRHFADGILKSIFLNVLVYHLQTDSNNYVRKDMKYTDTYEYITNPDNKRARSGAELPPIIWDDIDLTPIRYQIDVDSIFLLSVKLNRKAYVVQYCTQNDQSHTAP